MCEKGHDFTHWQGVVGITDILLRQCRRCGVKEMRILPPDVAVPDTRDRETFWLWPEEDS